MSDIKHILVVSQYYWPEAFRINDMCAQWVKRGYKVTVLTGIPNYPYGSYFEGYGLFKKRREQHDGVDIIRIPLIARGKGSVGMVLNYLSFVVSGFFWKSFTKLKADLVFNFEVSPMTQALVGVWYARRRKIPCLLYVQDLWPENIQIVTGINSTLVLGPIGKMVDYIYRRCDRIFATSPSFVKMIEKRVPDCKERISYWPQYAEDFYQPRPKGSSPLIPDDERFKVAFTGNVGQAQGLEILPHTAAILKEKYAHKLLFVIVGDGRSKEALQQEIRAQGVEDMFLMIERQSAETIPDILGSADAAFVSFMDNPLFENTIPAKLQSYMACGKAIVASASGETERIVNEAGCGVCSPIGDAAALAEKLEKLMHSGETVKMGENARAYFEKHYVRAKLLDDFDRCLEGLQGGKEYV
ncbi:MAG: glycosyltransferase family 4 protein [Oscillospiraceae bacterium]|nr:glycosyltransferase family 4 protein [Oscillospiraceae bacterium]